MKKIFYFLTVIPVILCVACGKPTKDKLVGTWKIKSISGTILSANEIETIITISSDGKWKSKMGQDSSNGTWTLTDDEKKVRSVFEGETDTTYWNIVLLDDKQFVYTVDKDTTKVTLEKLKEKR